MNRQHRSFFMLITLCVVLFLLLMSFFPIQAQTTPVWPMWGHDQSHTNRSPSNGPNSQDLAWTFPAASGGAFGDMTIAADGTIYVPEWHGYTSTNYLVAVNPNGTEKWRIPGTYSGLAIAADGTIYFEQDTSYRGEGTIQSLDPSDGHVNWSYLVGFTWSKPLIGPDGTIYVASGDCPGRQFGLCVYAIKADGTTKWVWDSQATYCGFQTTPALGPNGDIYFVTSGCFGLVALSSTGQFKWSIGDGIIGQGFDSPSVGPDGTIYIGCDCYEYYAVNPNGTYKWTVAVDNWMDQSSAAITEDGKTVYRGDNGGVFYAFNAGHVLWKYNPGVDALASGGPTLAANGLVYFTEGATTATQPDAKGYLYALRASDGVLIWRYEIGFPGSTPVLGSDGTLYVVGDSPDTLGSGNSNMLYAFRCADGICAIPPHDSTHTVTNLNDSGAGSLRQAVADSIYGDNIQFQSELNGTLRLSSTLTIDKNLTVNGPGANKLTISGNNTVGVFEVLYGVKLDINAVTIANGNASSGGGINNGGTLTLVNSVLSANTATGRGGGGIYNGVGATLNIRNSTFSGNTTTWSYEGAAIYNCAGLMDIRSSTFSNNQAGWGAGAILNTSYLFDNCESATAIATISNSTFYGNRISGSGFNNRGGAIHNQSGAVLTIINSTFSSNVGTGSAIDNSGTITIKNSIIANNPGTQCTGTVINGGHNLQYPGTDCGTSIPVGNPLLATLANNGGSTWTMALQPGSPAIDTGDNSICAASPVNNLDQRDTSRPIDGDRNGSAQCDVGAFEAGIAAPPSPTITSFTPTSGPVGTNVTITGTNFTGATAVKFNGINAGSFKVVSATSMTATVPAGATTGLISITSSGGAATSSTLFTVTSAAGAAPVRDYFMTDTPTLTWNEVTWATSYLVQVSKSTSFSSLEFSTIPALPSSQLSITTPSLPEGTYYWRVSANNGLAWSPVNSFIIDLS